MAPYIGQIVYWFPRGVKFPTTIPRVAVIQKVHPGDIVDACILPAQDGACEYKGNIFPVGDGRLQDARGNLTRAANERGFWEPIVPPEDESTKKKAK